MKLTLGGLIPADCVGRDLDTSPDDWRVSAGYHEKGRQGSHVKRVMRQCLCPGTLGMSPTMCGVPEALQKNFVFTREMSMKKCGHPGNLL